MKSITTHRLKDIAAIVNNEHGEIEKLILDGMARALKIGELLTEAKGLTDHGSWGKWIKDNCTFSERTAQYYIRVFANYPQLAKSATVADLTYKQAIGLLTEPKESNPQPFPINSHWTDRLAWAKVEFKRIEALAIKVNNMPFDAPDYSTNESAARRMLKTAQDMITIEDLMDGVTRYKNIMGAIMLEAKQEQDFPTWDIPLQRKVNEWIEYAGAGGVQ